MHPLLSLYINKSLWIYLNHEVDDGENPKHDEEYGHSVGDGHQGGSNGRQTHQPDGDVDEHVGVDDVHVLSNSDWRRDHDDLVGVHIVRSRFHW